MNYHNARANNQSVQPKIWLPAATLPNDIRYVKVVKLPPQLGKVLSGWLDEIDYTPVASLHDALAAFSENILAFAPNVFRKLKDGEKTPDWLYLHSDTQLNSKHLRNVLTQWLVVTQGEEQAARLQEEWGSFHWTENRIDLQTASLDQRKMLLPVTVARWLIGKNFRLKIEGKDQSRNDLLHLVPAMSQRGQVELMTDPIPGNLKDDSYSYLLRLWADSMPGSDELYLYAKAGVRRWHHDPLVKKDENKKEHIYLNRKQNRAVYVSRKASGYVDQGSEHKLYAKIRVRHTGVDVKWIGYLSKLALRMNMVTVEGGKAGEFPEPKQFLTEPVKFKNWLLMSKLSHEGRKGEAGTGLPRSDHRQIFKALNSVLVEGKVAVSAPQWPRVITGDVAPKDRSYSAYKEQPKSRPTKLTDLKKNQRIAAQDAQIKREALLAIGKPVTIELWIDRNALLLIQRALLKEVGLYEQCRDQIGNETLIASIHGNPLLTLIYKDPEGVTGNRLLDNVQNMTSAADSFRSTTAKRLQVVTGLVGSLIHMPNYQADGDWKEKKCDPKMAMRLAFADRGRVTQFLTPGAKVKKAKTDEGEKLLNNPYDPNMDKIPHKISSAVRDLLHHLGFRFNPLYKRAGTLPEHLDILGFSVIQLNARRSGEQTTYLPVAVEVQSGSRETIVYLPNSTGVQCCASLPEALLFTDKASTFEVGDDDMHAARVQKFFRDVLDSRDPARPTLLILPEQKLRKYFPALDTQSGQPQTTLDGILTGFNNIRVARLRFSRFDDAPFCVVTAKPKSKYHGLYGHASMPYVFGSIHDVGATKPSSTVIKAENPGTDTNPSTVQIWMNNLLSGDDPADFAGLVHRLRLEASHFDYPTLLPQPLHELGEIEAYLSRLKDDPAQSESNEDELIEVAEMEMV